MTTSWQPAAQTIFYSGYAGIFIPPAQSTNYGTQTTTESENTILPTTIVTSNGVTQTWSEAQVTSWSDLKTTTTTTSFFTENSVGTQTSTTTVVPIIIPINSGGFYWSPVPEPTDPAFPIPKAPGMPDVPSPHCFRFGDLFSIDCPPNDNKSPKTTPYTRGANSPTCSSGCGHLPSSSGSSSSSSSCTTQTVTSCRTYTTATPYQTVCASYEGCECVTKTVTDYDVSCGLTTCTTTASSVKTGCYVTESVSTTGEYCVAGVTVASIDDQGENGLFAPTQTGSSTTYAESVLIGGSTYTPTSGEIVVGGNTISIPSISLYETTTIDGTPVILIPEFTGIVASATITDILSGTVVVPGVTAAPTTASSTSTTTSATSKTSTAATATGTATETYTEVFIIAFAEDDSDLEPYSWEYFAHAAGASWTACDGLGSYPLSNSDTLANEPYPDGTIDIGVDILGMSDCVYTGTKDAPGTFTCPDLSSTVQCYEWDESGTSTCYGELSPTEITPVVHCPW
ncbi:hypothetical protein N7528_001043 [Penicillium herquei]|nr:hypothetical protein N7528_001043 [Penicillium herquei]